MPAPKLISATAASISCKELLPVSATSVLATAVGAVTCTPSTTTGPTVVRVAKVVSAAVVGAAVLVAVVGAGGTAVAMLEVRAAAILL